MEHLLFSQPVINQQCSQLMNQPQTSLEMVFSHPRVGANIKSTSTLMSITPPRLAETSPLPNSTIVSGSCDHNGGVISSEDGIKITVPQGAIKHGNLITFHITTGLYGPFVLPSKCQTNLASPYYWIGVSGSYRFQKPVQVEFEHFAVVSACDPSHYQLLCCEDDDESYTMRPVDCELSFEERERMSLCTFSTHHFCSYCLYHGCKDPMMNRIGAYFLKPKDFQYSIYFAVEVWFSYPITLCLKRNEELYTRENMILDSSFLFTAASSMNSTSYFTLSFDKEINGWDIEHIRSKMIETKTVNFYNYYANLVDLKESEEASLFPPRFVISVEKNSKWNMNLDTNIVITLNDDNEDIESVVFQLYALTSGITVKVVY